MSHTNGKEGEKKKISPGAEHTDDVNLSREKKIKENTYCGLNSVFFFFLLQLLRHHHHYHSPRRKMTKR